MRPMLTSHGYLAKTEGAANSLQFNATRMRAKFSLEDRVYVSSMPGM